MSYRNFTSKESGFLTKANSSTVTTSWKNSGLRSIQGLIQAAVALFHFGNGNLGGARKMYNSARDKLDLYPSPYMAIDLERFRIDLQHSFQELLDAGTTYPDGVELQDDRIPTIHLAEQD
jgi:uncharacterized protein